MAFFSFSPSSHYVPLVGSQGDIEQLGTGKDKDREQLTSIRKIPGDKRSCRKMSHSDRTPLKDDFRPGQEEGAHDGAKKKNKIINLKNLAT